jgi:hypothetical protein
VFCPSFAEVKKDKAAFAKACKIQYDEHDPVRGRAVIQKHGSRYLTVNPPAYPLGTEELDFVAQLPFTREAHPIYQKQGGYRPLKRFSSRSSITGAASVAVISVHWPFIRDAWLPHAVKPLLSERLRL